MPNFLNISNFFILLISETKIIQRRDIVISSLVFITYFMGGLFNFIPYFNVNLNKKLNYYSTDDKNNNCDMEYIYNENELIIENYCPHKIIVLTILLSLIIVIVYLLNNFIHLKKVFEHRLFY